MAARLGIEFGWHYLLDLIWVIEHLDQTQGSRIIDAGAGVGIIQWYLAEEGAEVISVDRQSRADLPLQFRLCYSVKGLREDDLKPFYNCIIACSRQVTSKLRVLLSTIKCVLRVGLPKPAPGRILIYNQDLRKLDYIEDNSIDTVVSISALEHNQREKMSQVVAELVRTLKPGGKLLATVNASKDQDWFHEPSQGWCLSEVSIREVFGLSQSAASNFDQYAEHFRVLCQCSELRDNLAKFYFRSGDNGMPWGKWNPQYIPVGVMKVKDHS